MGFTRDEYLHVRKIAIFPNNHIGRGLLAQFQDRNRILRVICGGMLLAERQEIPVNTFDRETKPREEELPCLVIEYIEGLHPTFEENEKQEPVRKKKS